MELTSDSIRHYREQGYLVVENLFTPNECQEINRHAEDVVMGRIPLPDRTGIWMEPAAEERELVKENNRYDYLFKIGHQMHITDPVFQRYAVHPRLADILEALIGPDIKCVQSMYIDKPREIGIGQPYHQDAWYLKTDPDTLIAAWIACDDADLDNGCLHVISGSQNDPIHPHEKPIDPAQRSYAEVHSARSRPEVAVPLKTGSAVFFGGHVLHRSGNNRSNRKRRSYVLHYADAKSKWLNDPKAKNPFLLVRGKEYPGCL